MIAGVVVKKLTVHTDERGRLMEILRVDDHFFQDFGQVYLTTAYPGVVKAWHYHRYQSDCFAVVKGMVKLVLYDAREASQTKGEINEFFIGEHNPTLIQIPPLIYHGFKGVSESEALVINIPTEPYNYKEPDELRVDPYTHLIPYDWVRKDG